MDTVTASAETSTPAPPTATSAPPQKTPTRSPTLTTTEMEFTVADMLSNNGGCDLPCLWGFIPGETDTASVLHFSSRLGWGYDIYENATGEVIYTGRDLETPPMSIRLAFYAKKEVLEAISFTVTHPEFGGREKWLAIEGILEQLGRPDQIWVSIHTVGEMSMELVDQPGYSFYLFYNEPLILLHYYGFAHRTDDTYSICLPNNEREQTTMEGIAVYSGSDELRATPTGIMLPFGRFTGKYSIEEAFSLSIDDFYGQVLSQQTPTCFRTPENIWE